MDTAKLAAIEWGSRFESFSEDALGTLRLYDERCTELGTSSFNTGPIRFTVAKKMELEHAGKDALRSMSMAFRQVWMSGEPAQFHVVLRLLRENVDPSVTHEPGALAILAELGRRFREANRQEMMKHVWADKPMGKPIRVFRARQVIEDWFYSGPFHTDGEKVKRVRSWSPIAYEWSFIKAVIAVMDPILDLHVIVASILAAER
jgi:hypothetical protein